MLNRRERLEGCLLGCAVGDAIGLPFEGISPRRIGKLLKSPLQHRLIFGHGMVSDDTDHSIFVAQALSKSPDDPQLFSRYLARSFRLWFLCLPAGIGLATLKSILKLWIGFPPSNSGVFSAGNGAAMRSAIIGVFHADNKELRQLFVSASTKITHSDPKANIGSQAIADLSAYITHNDSPPSLEELQTILEEVSQDEAWREVVARIMAACSENNIDLSLVDLAKKRGVSGYVYHTVPVAISAWYINRDDFAATVKAVVSLGGDTDTVAAIAASLAGTEIGKQGIPDKWINHLVDYPHNPKYISETTGASLYIDASRELPCRRCSSSTENPCWTDHQSLPPRLRQSKCRCARSASKERVPSSRHKDTDTTSQSAKLLFNSLKTRQLLFTNQAVLLTYFMFPNPNAFN